MTMRAFEYVPAAINARTPNSYVAVKLQDNTKSKDLWSAYKFDGVTTMTLPDRTVYVGASLKGTSGMNNVDYDKIMPIGVSNDPSILYKAGYRYGMVSPYHGNITSRRNKLVKLFSDSGGFQLVSGVTDFIEPVELAHFYNKFIDYGIGLDIPVGKNDHLLLRMVDVMIKNNKLIRKHLKSDVSLYDVSHGNNLKLRSIFLDRLLKEKELGIGMAVGGIGQNNSNGGELVTAVQGTINLLYTLLRTKGIYKQYHVLGTTGGYYLALYQILVRHQVAPHITADSASYVLAAANNQTLFPKNDSFGMSSLTIPKKTLSYRNKCSCPLCSMVKYNYPYYKFSLINLLHNLYSIRSTVDLIEDVTEEFLDGHITIDTYVSYISTGSSAKVYKSLLLFVLDACKTGFKSAYEKHYAVLKPFMRGVQSSSLFKNSGSETDLPPALDNTQRIENTIKLYEEYHRKRK